VNSPSYIKTGVRIPELDGLRGIAILLVLFHHYISGHIKPDSNPIVGFINAASTLAWSGVDLFFVLSGFLIGGILLDQRGAENYFKTFYLRRICRIFPLYFSWLVLFVILSRLCLLSPHPGWQGEIFNPNYPNWAYALFLQNFFVAKTEIFGPIWLIPTWSLAVEEQFYLLAPLLIWFLPFRKLPHVLVPMILLVPLLRLFSFLYHPTVFVYVLLPYRADALLMGVLCAYGVRHERLRSWLEQNQSRLYQALLVLLAGTVYLNTPRINSRDSFEMVILGYTWLPLLFSCLLLIVITAKQGMIARVMRMTALRRLGIISYGVFLMHTAIGGLTHGLILGKDLSINNLADGVATLVAFLLTLLLAALSWRFFEKPIIDWGHSFSYTSRNICQAT
jgi:peptidoglycan/LPS O-acetylase OafA/YrhL